MVVIKRKGFDLFRVLFFLFLIHGFSQSNAQTISKISCLVPYQIEFSKLAEKDVVEKEVYFEFHDDYPFWYKIHYEENTKVTYNISSLDENRNFDIYLYQYDGNQFCKMFINNNLEMISFEKSLEYKSSKGSTYYLGIYPLNSGGCGHKISLDADGKRITLKVLNAKEKCGREEVVSNPEVAENKSEVNISGEVVDKMSRNRINAKLTLIDPFTGHTKDLYASDKEGFDAALLEDGDYKVMIRAFGYKDLVTAVPAYNGDFIQFEMETSGEMNYVLENVYFYPNTFALKDESIGELESVASFIKNNPGNQMLIIGHTNGDKDIKSSRFVKESGEEWNFNGSAQELSLRRAQKIKDYLIGEGIDEYLLQVQGKGGQELIVQNPTNLKEAMKNIRVEIKISRQD